MSDKKELAKEIFDRGVSQSWDRDTTIVEMVQAGLTLNTAQIQYKALAKEAGISGRPSRKLEALEWLRQESPNIGSADTRSDIRSTLVDMFDVKPGTANDYIKAYAEEVGVEIPASSPGSVDGEQVYEFIKDNFYSLDKPAFKDFMEGLGRAKGSIDETWRGVVLSRRLIQDGVINSNL